MYDVMKEYHVSQDVAEEFVTTPNGWLGVPARFVWQVIRTLSSCLGRRPLKASKAKLRWLDKERMSSKGMDAVDWLEAADFLLAFRQILKQSIDEGLACRSTTHTQGMLAGFLDC